MTGCQGGIGLIRSGFAFQRGLDCVHSLSHALGGLQPRLRHGTLNALFLPAVLRFNAVAPSVQQAMCEATGLPSGLGTLDVEREVYAAACARGNWVPPHAERPLAPFMSEPSDSR